MEGGTSAVVGVAIGAEVRWIKSPMGGVLHRDDVIHVCCGKAADDAVGEAGEVSRPELAPVGVIASGM
jgi:hypothetical protein